MLRVEHLAASYGKIAAVSDVCLVVPEGRMVAMLGRNGAGKTTSVKAICGLHPVKSGTVHLGETRISGMPGHKIVRQGVSLVPQGRELFPGLSVLDNLQLGAYTVKDRKQVAEALERVFHYFPPLAERRSQSVGSLSGGEQQMVAVGRALMTTPRVLILDEPSAGLAPKILRNVFEIVASVSKDHKTAVLISEQNAREAMRVADNVYVIESGEIVAEGTPKELQGNRQLMDSYLGEAVVDDATTQDPS